MIVPAKTNTGTKTLIDSYKESVPAIPLLTSKGHPRGVFESGGHPPPSRPLRDPCNFARVLPEGAGSTGRARPSTQTRHGIFS
jgi:hypothetical protein